MYASAQDMVAWLGEAEMVQLTAERGQLDGPVVEERAEAALRDASAVIDTALRRYYALPLLQVPAEIARMCRLIARYELSQGDGRTAGEDAVRGYEEAKSWLKRIAADEFQLDLPRAATRPAARVSDRPRQCFGLTG